MMARVILLAVAILMAAYATGQTSRPDSNPTTLTASTPTGTVPVPPDPSLPSAMKSQPTNTSVNDSSGGTVHVKGYYRKDGTYVAPYDRRAPSRR